MARRKKPAPEEILRVQNAVKTLEQKYPRVLSLKREITRLEAKTVELSEELDLLERSIVAKTLGIDVLVVDIGTYFCLDSPLTTCAYDNWKDPAHDECLFCGEPEERK